MSTYLTFSKSIIVPLILIQSEFDKSLSFMLKFGLVKYSFELKRQFSFQSMYLVFEKLLTNLPTLEFCLWKQ